METFKQTVKGAISLQDPGLQKLMREYVRYKKVLIPRVQQAVRPVIKDKSINAYSQQKWMVDRKLSSYLKNLPMHPMPFHNESVWILRCQDCRILSKNAPPKGPTNPPERADAVPADQNSMGGAPKKFRCDECPYKPKDNRFWIHFRTAEGETACRLYNIPPRYRSAVERACGKGNPILGQVELVEDRRYDRINCHICLRFPKPKPYVPKVWVGVDIGWNKLATSIACTCNPHLRFFSPTVHGKQFKSRVIQLRHLLKEYARKGKAWKKWDSRLKHTDEYIVGVVAKEIVSKTRRLRGGVGMEQLTFKSVTKGFLIPRHKLVARVKFLCEMKGVPFCLVPAQYTSITCPKCGYVDKGNRNGKRFKCLRCGYQADSDVVGAMNVAMRACLMNSPKRSQTDARNGGRNALRLVRTAKTNRASRSNGRARCKPIGGDERCPA